MKESHESRFNAVLQLDGLQRPALGRQHVGHGRCFVGDNLSGSHDSNHGAPRGEDDIVDGVYLGSSSLMGRFLAGGTSHSRTTRIAIILPPFALLDALARECFGLAIARLRPHIRPLLGEGSECSRR
jgi:hypothetical protein